MASTFTALYKSLKDYTGTISNSVIVLATTGLQQLTTLAVYRCPCVEPSNLGEDCENQSAERASTCFQRLNFNYGLAYIIAPAIALYLFSIAASPNFWKSITGCVGKSAQYKRATTDASWTLLAIFSQAVVAPVTWVCIALIDGRYLACSITIQPYDIGPEGKYSSCNQLSVTSVSGIYLSNEFLDNRTMSQLIGAICVTVLLFVAFVIYCFTQCTHPLTYYHSKYYRVYREMEQAEFEDEMRKKAQHEAESNVQQFLKERRDKALWDRISTVFQFHRDKKQLALYSQLYEWVNEVQKEELNKSGTEEALLKKECNTESMA